MAQPTGHTHSTILNALLYRIRAVQLTRRRTTLDPPMAAFTTGFEAMSYRISARFLKSDDAEFDGAAVYGPLGAGY